MSAPGQKRKWPSEYNSSAFDPEQSLWLCQKDMALMRRLSDRGHLLPADLPSLADPPSTNPAYARATDRERYAAALREAGLPEG